MPAADLAPRRRHSAEEARQRILEAAQRRLAASGPEGLRLQEIASDLGISHPAILHHFGSREGLLQALAAHSGQSLNAEIAERIRAGGADLGEILALTRETLASQGQARLLAWLALSGRLPAESPPLLQGLVEVVHTGHAARRAEQGKAAPRREDTVHAVLLVAFCLFGEALVGDLFRASVGQEDPDSPERFQAWLGELLERQFSR